MWSLLYTGSRTAMVILPIGLIMVAAITLHRRILISVGIAGLIGAGMFFRPQSGALYIMSTAFSGADDPSMNLRLKNREMVRSFILASPIGYGLGATGYLGKKYSPNTPSLARLIQIPNMFGSRLNWGGSACFSGVVSCVFFSVMV